MISGISVPSMDPIHIFKHSDVNNGLPGVCCSTCRSYCGDSDDVVDGDVALTVGGAAGVDVGTGIGVGSDDGSAIGYGLKRAKLRVRMSGDGEPEWLDGVDDGSGG